MKQLILDVLGIKSKAKNEDQIFNLPLKQIGDVCLGTDGRYKLIMKVTPINGDLMDNIDISEVANAIQGALASYEGRLQILIQSEKIDIDKNINNMDQVQQYLNDETKIELLQSQKNYLISMKKKIKNVLNFYIVIETKGKDYVVAEQILDDYYLSMKSELEAQDLYTIKLEEKDIKVLLYERLNPDSAQEQPIQDEWELNHLMPMNAKRHKDGRHLEVENYIYRHYAITNYPQEVDKYRWLRKVFNFNDRIFISITLTPKNKATINEDLSKAIKEIGRKQYEAKEDHIKQRYSAQIESARQMIQEIGGDNVSLYDTNITLSVGAKDMKQLNRLSSNLLAKISSSYCQATELKYKDFEPFFTTLPLLADNKITNNFVWNLTSKDIAALVPFDSSELMEDKGILIGENIVSRGVAIIDMYNRVYNNPHLCIIADSGSGKSFWIACHIIREVPYRDYIIQFDVDGSARFPWAKKYKFSPTTGIITNPFHIRNTTLTTDEQDSGTEVGSFLAVKIMDLITFFKWIIPEMTSFDEALLEEDIRETYSKFSLTFESSQLPNVFPTISDLVATMREKVESNKESQKANESRENMIVSFKPYESGSYSKLFNGQTNWEYHPHVILDVSALPEAVQKPMYELLLKDTWQFCKSHGTLDKMPTKITKKVVIDEAHIFADPKNQQTLKFISTELLKQSRKFGVSVVTATQNITDFTSIERYGQAVIDNSFFKIFFRLGENDHALAKALYGFSDKEMKVIKGSTAKGKGGSGKGKGIFMAGSQRILIQSRASKDELEIIDPVQFEEIHGVKSRYM
ncbi:VirB4 family type IV secretion system protein [Clostridium sp.]|uniref:VirB4 family type IV secretion system protein n=1 Tax=Clostridium sp. TaxID=1506 RepID=UPI003F341AA2